MQLLNGANHGGSALLEIALSLGLIIGVGAGVYTIQHAHPTMVQH